MRHTTFPEWQRSHSGSPNCLHQNPQAHSGGMRWFARACRKLGRPRLFQRSSRMSEGDTVNQSSDLFLAVLYALMARLRRSNKSLILQYRGCP